VVRIDDNHVAAAMGKQQELMVYWYLIALLVLLIFSIPLGQMLERRRICANHIEMLHQAIEHAGESIMITDAAGVIEHVNPAFTVLTGYSASDAVGKKPLRATEKQGTK